MRGGHFVFGLCRCDDMGYSGAVQPPNCAYVDEEQARADLLIIQEESPEEHWIVKSIWLCDEVY